MSKLVDLLKEELKEQIAHVSTLEGNEYNSQEYYNGMASGSDLLLSIIDSFFRRNSGTAGYLNLLDEDQLAFALSHTQSLIKRKENESKIRLWSTTNGDYWVLKKSLAVQQLKDEVAKMDVESDPDLDDFKIHTALVRESELSKYLDPKVKI